MSVWFATRSPYDLPAAKFVKRFDEPTLLEWFRTHCQPIADYDAAEDYTQRLFGYQPDGFPYFLTRLAEDQIPPPQNNQQFQDAMRYWGPQGEMLFGDHSIQWLDDDDELEYTFYLFDETFARKHPERVAWLMHEDWRLPAEAGEGTFKPCCPTRALKPEGPGEGTTYCVFLAYYDSGSMSDLFGAESLQGVRLPDLARYLAQIPVKGLDEAYDEWPSQLRGIRRQLLRSDRLLGPTEKVFLEDIRKKPADDTAWGVYGDWLEEQGKPRAELWLLERALQRVSKEPAGRYSAEIRPSRKNNRSRWRVEPHLAQLSLHTASFKFKKGTTELYSHWALFDDLWASAHPDLANSLLLANHRWDMLSGARGRRPEE